MASITYATEDVTIARHGVDWSAIWAGVFTYIAIWSVFGTLGAAIFASSAHPNAAHPLWNMGVGMGIWAVILTIIAMYVAGVVTGRWSVSLSRGDRMWHGMAMFGLSMVATLIMLAIGSNMTQSMVPDGSVHSPYFLSLISQIGWAGFIALFLGWLAALGAAASSGTPTKRQEEKNVQPIRPAA
jgi:hypothetical protein